MLFSLSLTAAAQHTVGLLSVDHSKALPGYTLIYPSDQPTVYLLDNCGRVVHTWEDSSDFRPGNSVFLLDNGTLLKTKRHASLVGDPINGPGAGATVEMRDWDNNLKWTFTLNDSFSRLHHDITPMPNGNILMISWDKKTKAEAIAAGRNPATISVSQMWPEKIIEVQPIGLDSFNIVWQWNEWDHLIQDFDSLKPNYGDVAANPEKIDLNWGSLGGAGGSAWTFLNSIDYDESRDQILLSTRFFNEVWILDHSTSTLQAKGSTGGNSGKGGDLLFRWGNPRAYKMGTAGDQKTYSQHTARWLSHDPLDSNFGKVMLFNNMSGPNFSTVDIIQPAFNSTTKNYDKNAGVFLPQDFFWTYKRTDPADMYSTGFGGAQLLSNGNILVCSGRQGDIFEITPSNEIVWEYVVPFNFGVRAKQGDTIPISNNSTFRAERFEPNFPVFAGKDLSPKGFIELEPDTNFCSLPTNIVKTPETYRGIQLYPNPASNSIRVGTGNAAETLRSVLLYSSSGKLLMGQNPMNKTFADLDVSALPDGLYFVSVNGHSAVQKLVVRH